HVLQNVVPGGDERFQHQAVVDVHADERDSGSRERLASVFFDVEIVEGVTGGHIGRSCEPMDVLCITVAGEYRPHAVRSKWRVETAERLTEISAVKVETGGRAPA